MTLYRKQNADEKKTTRKVFIAHDSRVTVACKAKESNMFTCLRIFDEYKERYIESLFQIRNYKEPKLVYYNRNSHGLEETRCIVGE